MALRTCSSTWSESAGSRLRDRSILRIGFPWPWHEFTQPIESKGEKARVQGEREGGGGGFELPAAAVATALGRKLVIFREGPRERARAQGSRKVVCLGDTRTGRRIPFSNGRGWLKNPFRSQENLTVEKLRSPYGFLRDWRSCGGEKSRKGP